MGIKKSSRTEDSSEKQLALPTSPNEASEAPVKARHFRKKAKEEIEKNYAGIVKKLGEEARSGSIAHAKVLFELGDMDHEIESTRPKKRRGPSLAKLLIQEAQRAKREQEKQAIAPAPFSSTKQK